jgi:hypothetical protein
MLLLGVKWSRETAREIGVGSIVIVTVAAIYGVAYVTTPLDLKWQLAVSLPRLALHLWPPLLFILTFGLARRETMRS